MGKEKEIDDSAIIEFEAGCDEEHKIFVLHIKADQQLSDLEYAAALRSFAEDIENGKFNFDDIHGAPSATLN